MSDPKIAELIAMSKAADLQEGKWQVGQSGWCDLVAYNGEDIIGIAQVTSAKRVEFIAALVNWFRETYTKERA